MRLEVRALPPERLRHSATDVVEHQKGITNLPREGRHHTVPSSRGLGHHPLKVETRVRTPLGLPGMTGSEAKVSDHSRRLTVVVHPIVHPIVHLFRFTRMDNGGRAGGGPP